MADGKVIIETDLDESGVRQGLSRLEGAAKVGMTAVAAAVAATTAAIAAMGGYAVKVGSDFEAGMSKVGAISGATGEDLDQLSEKAKEMGAKTKFSATEASDAFSYMAMAGWKTTDMLDGIDGIMNLAAASGEDLASVSDIVTDALTAFGLQAGDSAHFADVLAKASSNSNTNVGLMGATFKYVAPIAGAMGYSIEDTAVAIGLMANAGIKGEQAGTSLRAMLTRLASPTAETAQAMEDLGINITNADGTMKPFNEVIGQLRTSFSNLSDSQKTQYASSLAGQEAMSGLLAIVGASDSDFNKLVGAIDDADGAAQEMAETMQDNLQGKFTILKSSLEGFGIQVYESMEAPLKSAVEVGIDSVEQIANAFSSGGLKGAVKEAGEIFGELVNRVAESDTSFGKILKPIGNVAKAGLDLAKVVLPPVTKGLGIVADNLDILIPLLAAGYTGFSAYKVLTKVSKWFTATAAASKAYAAAIATAITIDGVATNLASTAHLLLASTMSTSEIVIGVLTGKMSLATATTTLWAKAQAALTASMLANPIVLVGAAVAALATGLVAYTIITEDTIRKNYELSESEKEVLKTAEEVTDSLNAQKEAREEAVQSINMEYDGYEALLTELSSITEENGRIKAGYEDRAAVITGELSEALGMEISMTDGAIQMNGQYVGSMDAVENAIKDVIVQKKADALLTSMQDEMANAFKNSKEAMLAYKDAVSVAEEKQKALEKAQAEYNAVSEQFAGNTGPMALSAMSKAESALNTAQTAFDEASTSVDKTKTSLGELSSEVNNYDALVEAMASGTTADIESAMNSLLTGYQSYTAEMLATSDTAQVEMLSQAEDMVGILSTIVSEGGAQYQAFGDEAASAVAKSVDNFNNLPGGIAVALERIGPEAGGAMIASLAQADLDGKLDAEGQESLTKLIAAFDTLPADLQETMNGATEGAMKGLDGFDEVSTKAEEGGTSFLEALREVLQINSPSKAVAEIFEGVWEGASNGLDVGSEDLGEKATTVCTSFLDTLRNSGLVEGAQQIGSNIMSFFGTGVSSQTENSRIAGAGNAEAANSGASAVNPTGTGASFGSMLSAGVSSMRNVLFGSGSAIGSSSESGFGSINPSGTGRNFGTMLSSGVSAMSSVLHGSGSAIGRSADSGAGSVNPSGTGRSFGNWFASGVGGQTGVASANGRSLANSADSGARSADGSYAGSMFGSGFCSGIRRWIGNAVSAAASLAASALNTAKNFLGIRSPSREAAYLGRMFDEGFTGSIEDGVSDAETASKKLANAALNGLDVKGLADKMRLTVATEQSNMSQNITTKITRVVETKYEDSNNQEEFLNNLSAKLSVDIVSAFAKAGIVITMDKKPVGKILTPEVDRNMRLRKV